MQAAPIPKAPDPYAFNRRLNALITAQCQERDLTYLIRHQLRLQYPQTVTHFTDGVTLDMNKLETYPVDVSLTRLPVVRRIKIAADLLGLEKAAQALHDAINPSPLPILSEQVSKEVEAFRREVAELTEGVVSFYELDAFRVMRVFLFSAVGRWLHKDSALTTKGFETKKDGIEECRCLLLQMFGFIASFENYETFPAALPIIDRVLNCLSIFQKPPAKAPLERQQYYDEVEKIRRLLRMFRTALQKPYIFLPLMLGRVRVIPVNTDCGIDKESIDPRAGAWLHEFELAWETQIQPFFPHIKKVNAGNRKFKKLATEIENFAESLLRDARNKINPDLTRALHELHAFEQLPVQIQRNQIERLEALEKTSSDLGDRIQAFINRHVQLNKSVQELIPLHRGVVYPFGRMSIEDPDPAVQLKARASAEAEQPIYFYWRLATSIVDAVLKRSGFYQKFYQAIDQVMAECPFRTLQNVDLLNLLQWQLRAQFLVLQEQLSDNKTLDAVGNVHARFDGLLAIIRRRLVHDETALEKKVQSTNRAIELEHLLTDVKTHNHPLIEPLIEPLLVQYNDITRRLASIFLMKDWQKLFRVNPFALDKQQDALEQQFYFELFVSCRKMVLIPQHESFLETLLPHKLTKEDEPFFSAVQKLMDEFRDLSKVRDALRRQETATLANYQGQARELIARMTTFAQSIEERTGELQLLISLHLAKCDSTKLKELSERVQNVNEAIQSLFFSPAQLLISHLHVEELLADDRIEAQKKQERKLERSSRRERAHEPPVKPLLPPVAAQEKKKTIEKKVIEQPASLWVTFQESYLGLLQYFEKRKQSESEKACLQNLAGNLSLLQDLVETVNSHGERPHFVLEANLALMVHLEQTLSLLNMSQSRTDDESSKDVYRKMGLETEWTDHAPHLQINQELDLAHIAFMSDRERVIAISSRYPGSGKDRLSDSAKRALTLSKNSIPLIIQRYREGMQADLNSGLKACQALLDTQQFARGFVEETPLSLNELESLFTPVPELEPDWESTKDSCLSRFETALARIQQYRMVTIHREVPASEFNGQERKGTIQLALADLEMTARLCRDLLKDDQDAYQGLIVSRQAWLRQAVALERVLLLMLSHLPAAEADCHWLWVDTQPRRERYSHHLVAYTQKLRQVLKGTSQLLDETEELAKDIEPYLKTLYRYHASSPCPAKARLNKIEGLMRLRRQLQGGRSDLPKALDHLLGASQSGERVPLLDAHILKVVRHDATRPLLETLDLAEEWLQIYKKHLFGLYNP